VAAGIAAQKREASQNAPVERRDMKKANGKSGRKIGRGRKAEKNEAKKIEAAVA